MRIRIDALRESDWPRAGAIFAEGLATGLASFDTEVPSWREWDAAHLAQGRLAARAVGADGGADGELLGWAALLPVSDRCCYAGVAEESIYVAEAARGEGVGRRLLQALVERSEELGIWTLQAGIFPDNEASIALHQSCGFRVVGVRERLGQLDGAWKDVALMERRSARVGNGGAAPGGTGPGATGPGIGRGNDEGAPPPGVPSS